MSFEAQHPQRGKRIVLNTFGSLGDLHPYIAISKGLQERGHRPVIATSELFRSRVQEAGIEHIGIRPDVARIENDSEMFGKIMDPKGGTEFLFKEIIMPAFAETYADMERALEGADLFVSHPLSFAGVIIAQKRNLPWVSTVLAPASFLSAYDFPALPQAPGMSRLRFLGPVATKQFVRRGRQILDPLFEPVYQARLAQGMPRGATPILEGQHSPQKVLALFSKVFAKPQPDWPQNTVVTGFPVYDGSEECALPEPLEAFLQKGAPPLVFTLGSAAVKAAGDFYEQSVLVAQRANRRAVFLAGKERQNWPKEPLPKGMIALEYAPYSQLFPRACALVSSGGIGTVAQGILSGRPMLVMPFGHDQRDNAERVCKLGIGRMILRERYNPLHGAAELLRFLGEPLYPTRAQEVAKQAQQENGVANACDAIESVLSS